MAPGAAALALSCAALAGCGVAGGSSPGPATPAASSSSAGSGSTHTGKLTGNFCTDFKNLDTNLPIPSSVAGSLTTLEQHDGRYLKEVSSYYAKLAAEASPQVRQEIRRIAAAYRGLASSISNGTTRSLSQIEQQITSIATSGAAANAFKQLVTYVTTKCT